MPRRKPRKAVPVGKLAEFAGKPDTFRKRLGRVRDPEAAAAGTKAHRQRGKPQQVGQRPAKATIMAIVAAAVLSVLSHQGG